MCCTEFIVKYVLFFFNLAFSLAGIALIGVGAAVLVNMRDLSDLIPANLTIIPTLIIVTGSIIFLISFSGCWGAARENGCLLIVYAICMVIFAAAKIALVVVIRNNLNGLQDTVADWVDSAFQASGQTVGGRFRALELLFECCGTTGVNSYNNLPFIPPTCCANPSETTGCAGADSFYGGCSTIFSDYLSTYGDAIGYVLIVIICIELLAMVFALYLNHQATGKRRMY